MKPKTHSQDRSFIRQVFSNGTLLSVLGLLVAGSATAIPMNYDISVSGGNGTFTVDPALAAPVGNSLVAVSAFELNLSSVEFGSYTIELADITTGTLNAAFRNGLLAGLDINSGSGLIPATDLGFEMTFDTANPVLDLSSPGEANIIVIDTNTFVFKNHCCSYSITESDGGSSSPIPEPSAALVFAAGLLILRSRTSRRPTV